MRGSVFFACCNLQVSLEPSLESGKPGSKQGQSAVLSIVREKPHELQVGVSAHVCICAYWAWESS